MSDWIIIAILILGAFYVGYVSGYDHGREAPAERPKEEANRG
jgi:hypothetical protein